MDLLVQNLVSLIVLAFALDMVARWVKSDLEIPDAIYQALSIYLLFAIGLKGGVAISETPASELVGPISITLILGIITPISAFIALKYFGRLNRIDSAASSGLSVESSLVCHRAVLPYSEPWFLVRRISQPGCSPYYPSKSEPRHLSDACSWNHFSV